MSTVNAVNPMSTRRYGRSVLVSALRLVARGWQQFVIVVVVNAVAQSLLSWAGLVPSSGGTFLLAAAASLVLLLLSLALIGSTALESVDGRARWGAVVGRVRSHAASYLLWTVLLLVAITAGLLVWVVPGIVVVALTPMVVVAALDGRRDALRANFSAVRARPGRWLVTALLMALVVGGGWLAAVLTGLLVAGWLGPLVVWLGFGVLAAWFECAWALLYRSTPVGSPEPIPVDVP